MIHIQTKFFKKITALFLQCKEQKIISYNFYEYLND
ncbi:unknown [[Mannheimia] succiniciproducens MBEL55E]|uniref:Uncharacterized protein n=1 Tax=Mannheimia succiniciproducens (strain KCTC 0769BP / MBEL55E) TaxID=221988 RepID=Q65T46_MANSM|nr:unknown [[Mannheimia] succiniciproducens MBEL55E]